MGSITLKNVNKIYPGNVQAVKDFSLEIQDEEFLVLVGPSGCGKSTVLRMIAGLEEITSGELYIADERVNDIAPKDRDIAMVFQNYGLYPHMSVYKNLSFALSLRHLPNDEIDRKVRETANLLELGPLLDRRPKALSGGQRQRVALGRAMVRDPKAFLLDEPLSNLDAKLRASTRTEIKKLHQKLKTTFVYVTHDQVEAMTMADRIVVMKDGCIQQIGEPQELYEQPCNAFVGGFIGTPQMNFLEAVIDQDAQGWFLLINEARIRLPDGLYEDGLLKRYQSEPILVGIRAEDVHETSSANQNGLAVSVEVQEHMGCEILVHLDHNGEKITARFSSDLDSALRRKDRLEVTFKAEKLHLFDPATEVRLKKSREGSLAEGEIRQPPIK